MNRLKIFWRSQRRRWLGAIRYSSLLARLYPQGHRFLAVLARDSEGKLRHWLAAFRFAAANSTCERTVGKRLQSYHEAPEQDIWRGSQFGWERFQGYMRDGPVSRTIVLKAPRRDEKGVLLTSFEYNWFKLLRDADTARSLEKRFDIIFSTTSCPGDYAMLGLALATLSGPVYVMSCHYDEIPKFEKFHPRIKCLPMLPCDWLDPGRYQPKLGTPAASTF